MKIITVQFSKLTGIIIRKMIIIPFKLMQIPYSNESLDSIQNLEHFKAVFDAFPRKENRSADAIQLRSIWLFDGCAISRGFASRSTTPFLI